MSLIVIVRINGRLLHVPIEGKTEQEAVDEFMHNNPLAEFIKVNVKTE